MKRKDMGKPTAKVILGNGAILREGGFGRKE